MIDTIVRGESHKQNVTESVSVPVEARKQISRVRNVISVLSELAAPIFKDTIEAALASTKDIGEYEILVDGKEKIQEGISAIVDAENPDLELDADMDFS